MLIDESHNLRNREGKRYRAIQEYIRENESKVILLTATPYNKTYLDLSNQLRLFVAEDVDVGIRPEKLLREIGGDRVHSPPPMLRPLPRRLREERVRRRLAGVDAAVPGPPHASFIQDNYAETDPANGREFLTFRTAAALTFRRGSPRRSSSRSTTKTPTTSTPGCTADAVVDAINRLDLAALRPGQLRPRDAARTTDRRAEAKIIHDLSRAGQAADGLLPHQPLQAPGEQRPGLHPVGRAAHPAELRLPARPGKRPAVADRHAGRQLLDARVHRRRRDNPSADPRSSSTGDNDERGRACRHSRSRLRTAKDFRERAAEVYAEYAGPSRRRFKLAAGRPCSFRSWPKTCRPTSRPCCGVLKKCGDWEPDRDAKLAKLFDLLPKTHPDEKIFVFTQFADTRVLP